MHIHVYCGDGEAKFWLEPEIQLAHNYSLSGSHLQEIEQLIQDTIMSSSTPGKITSELEVTNISSHGIWLFSKGEELFLSYQDFPWFKEAPVGKIFHVEEPTPDHYYWPDLDIDLGKETIKHPEKFPLTDNAHP